LRPERENGAVGGSCTGVVKIYWSGSGEVHALKGIDAVFPPAAITALVGPSGSGKSSLLRILACVDRPTAGQVFVGAKEISAMSRAKRRSVRRGLVGYMFQRPADNLISYLTAAEHLEMAAKLRGSDRAAIPALRRRAATARARVRRHRRAGPGGGGRADRRAGQRLR